MAGKPNDWDGRGKEVEFADRLLGIKVDRIVGRSSAQPTSDQVREFIHTGVVADHVARRGLERGSLNDAASEFGQEKATIARDRRIGVGEHAEIENRPLRRVAMARLGVEFGNRVRWD